MTTNQTIDGVSRELLERLLGETTSWPSSAWLSLRDLLDAPACKACNGLGHVPDGEITGSGGVEFENGPVECVKDCPACKPAAQPQGEPVAFQSRVQPWMIACFGEAIASDRQERNHRFLEEALELVQANQCTASEAHQLVDYVYGRPVGEPSQEVGGVMVTLAALCLASGLDMHAAAETELARIWTKVDQIRAKQAAKPAMSPLPGAYPDREQPEEYEVRTLYRHPPAPRGEPDAWLAEATNSTGVVYRKVTSPAEITMRDVRFAWGEGVLKRYTICIRKLYAEQPAPAVVVLPEHRDTDLRSPSYGYARGWNACLDEVARLNSL
ncbi:hypothetical protein [Pseudomonas chlororaphis]|uniref:hypothetical protein n=1 Tax=Pseudomonas chlororaphis TaxID=587753 RepID=UPI001CC1FF03|nr:hypothetical protein [Pseudomonas chlororaphis]